jgi:oligoendopeptidase F
MGIDISDKDFWLEGIKETKDLLKEAKKLSEN